MKHSSKIRVSVIVAALVLNLPVQSVVAAASDARGSVEYRDAINRFYGVRTASVPKIIGGVNAEWNDHKWQVALLVSWIADPVRAQFCGGSLIRQDWVVTAAHCVDGNTLREDVNIFSGTANLGGNGQRLNVDSIFVHENYDPNTLDYDIALLKLRGRSTGESIALVTLQEEQKIVIEGEAATISGWGVTESGQGSPQLKELSVPLVGMKRCNGPAAYDGAITERMICAGIDQGGRDSCQGDSGGPNTKDDRLIGVVSWGHGCAEAFKYGVYSRVAVLQEWLAECIADPRICKVK